MSTTGPVQKPALVTLAGSDVILRVWVQKTALIYATSPGRGGLRPSSPQCLPAPLAGSACRRGRSQHGRRCGLIAQHDDNRRFG